jgi:hypothetical protein
MNKKEEIFKKIMESKSMTLISQPYIKKLKMRPDFYCVEDETYYEVVGTRQAWWQAKEKNLKAKRLGLKLKFVNPNGTQYVPRRRGWTPKMGPEEKRYIIQSWLSLGFNQSDIAKIMGMSRQAIHYWMNLMRTDDGEDMKKIEKG